LAVFLASLDQTIVSTAIPRIASEFGSLDQVAWIGIAYLLTTTAFQPLYGRFSDIFGRKPVFLAITIIFLLGSLGCGAANSMPLLIVMRAIAGIGGGGFIPLVMIIIIDLVPPRQRGQYAGIIGAVFAFSSVIGPLLGGVFTDHATWRWAFYINLPIGFVTIVIVTFLLKLPSPTGSVREKLRRVDYVGTVLLLGFCVTLLLPVNWGGSTYAWDDPIIIGLFCASAVLLALFLFVEGRFAKEPVVLLRMFRSRSLCGIFIGTMFFGWSFFSPIYYMPVFFQAVRNNTATESGLVLLPVVLPLSLTAIISGTIASRVGRWTYRTFTSGGMALATIAFGLITLYTVEPNRPFEIGTMILLGIGFGLTVQTATLAAQVAVPMKDAAMATALNVFFQVIGGVIGLAVEGTLFNNELSKGLADVGDQLPGGSPHGDISQSIEAIRALPDETRQVVYEAYLSAFQMQYYVHIPIAGLSALAYLFARPKSGKEDANTDGEVIMVMPMH
jgi:EmrB/QacA subfamily drug resistance transporter